MIEVKRKYATEAYHTLNEIPLRSYVMAREADMDWLNEAARAVEKDAKEVLDAMGYCTVVGKKAVVTATPHGFRVSVEYKVVDSKYWELRKRLRIQ